MRLGEPDAVVGDVDVHRDARRRVEVVLRLDAAEVRERTPHARLDEIEHDEIEDRHEVVDRERQRGLEQRLVQREADQTFGTPTAIVGGDGQGGDVPDPCRIHGRPD